MLKLVIFDYDGLMVNSEYVVYDALKSFFKKYNYDLSWKYFCKHIGKSVRDALKHFYKDYPLPLSFDEFLRERNKIVSEYVKKKLKLMPCLKELLDCLAKRSIPMAIATSGTREYIHSGLNKFGIKDYFKDIVCIDDVMRGKPHPDLIMETLRKTNFTASESLIIEDSPNGIEAARRAGIYSIAVPTEGVSFHEFKNANIISSSLKDVKELMTLFAF